MLLLVLAIASLGIAVFLVGEVATLPQRQRQGAMRRAATYGHKRRPIDALRDQAGFRERALGPMTTSLARGVLRLSPKATVDSINMKLLSAGLGRKISPTQFLAGKALFAALGFFFGATVAAAGSGMTLKGILAIFGLGLMGFMI